MELKNMTLYDLLSSGLLSQSQRLKIYNADSPMGRVQQMEDGTFRKTHYFIKEYSKCCLPQRYVYEKDEMGRIIRKPILDAKGKPIVKRDSNGCVVYKEDFSGRRIVDENGNYIPIYETEPVIIGETDEWKEFMEFANFRISHIYADFIFSDSIYCKEDTCLVIQIHGGKY